MKSTKSGKSKQVCSDNDTNTQWRFEGIMQLTVMRTIHSRYQREPEAN